MKSKWKAFGTLDANVDYVVLASSIPPKSMSSTWSLFQGARIVRRQMESTEGVLGFSLLAEPLRKRYATLSVWVDDAALDTFARTDPHARIMGELAAAMDQPKFVRWTISGSDGLPTWDDALSRLQRPPG